MGHSSPNQALEPTPYSVRCAPAFRRGSPPAFGNTIEWGSAQCLAHRGKHDEYP
jgi:hypothetical protein